MIKAEGADPVEVRSRLPTLRALGHSGLLSSFGFQVRWLQPSQIAPFSPEVNSRSTFDRPKATRACGPPALPLTSPSTVWNRHRPDRNITPSAFGHIQRSQTFVSVRANISPMPSPCSTNRLIHLPTSGP